MIQALKLGHDDFCKCVWEKEEDQRISLKDLDPDVFIDIGCRTLATMPTSLLLAVCRRDLAETYLQKKDPDVVSVIDTYSDR